MPTLSRDCADILRHGRRKAIIASEWTAIAPGGLPAAELTG